MIDLILYAPSKAALTTWAETNPPNNPMRYLDADSAWQIRPGLEWSWWGGDGNFKTSAGSFNVNSDAWAVEPTYAPGVVMRLRIHGEFFDWGRLDVSSVEDPDDIKEWELSRTAKYIKDNGTPGTMGGIPYYEVDGVRIFREKDVQTFISSRGLPGHVFL